jgi:hypothetical protein
MFNKKEARLDRKDIPDFDKVIGLVVWFIKNDKLVSEVNSRTNHIIFNEGYRPQPELENLNAKANDILDWFCMKVFLVLNFLKDSNKKEFADFIDILSEVDGNSLVQTMEIGMKYDFNFSNYIYELEIEKVSNEEERGLLKVYWLTSTVVSSEVRILAYLYAQYFGEPYQIKAKN